MFLRSICSIVRYAKCRNRYLERNHIGEKFRCTSLSTTRDGETWDVTRWIYDAATGLCTAKVYADGSQITYSYTPDGLPLRTTYASGRWTENVYNAKREVIETFSSDNADNVSYVKDEFGRIVSEANSVATVTHSLSSSSIATNEHWTLGNHTATVVRSLDEYGRISFNNGMLFTYADDGKLKGLSNGLAKVEYLYSLDRLDIGYKIELPNGRIFTRNAVRDSFRRGLMVNVASAMNGSEVDGIAYVYDALGRPVHRNSDSFGYNDRSEVSNATVSGAVSTYGYDGIGNSSLFAANNLNQYSMFQYDLDGNMLFDGNLSFAYDSDNRLRTVSSNGVVLVTNFYDAKSRRVKKVTPKATTTFIYDDWNLIEERVEKLDGTVSTIKYYWGKDLSGELQGAGGVGGLLYITVSNSNSPLQLYIPCYDNNGNVTKYIDANGNIVASYIYDAFGKLVSKSGPLADFFRHRFSTKYFDAETGLYYYGYRFYHPILMRWLNRDPIEENGGLNLYGFCENSPIRFIDLIGEQTVIKEENLIVKDKISSAARAAFFPSADVSFSCSWNGVLSINGTASRRIEIRTPDHARWAARNKNYNNKWGTERTNTMEWSAAYAHEMDHWNAFNSFFAFLHMLNEFDGARLCNKCTEMKDQLERQYNTMWLEAYQHSARYDMPGYNGGGLYPKAK